MNKSVTVNLDGESGGGSIVVSMTNLTQEEYKQIKKTLSKEFGIDF